ncbi:MAG: hypothetical protein O2992_04955 [Gemmatimonadetes bacterium]|nr:hypothetical protein [Gemmatimonadota bacterium]
MNQRPGDSEPPSGQGTDARRSGLGSKRVVAVSFGLSAVLHVVMILLYGVFGLELRPESPEFQVPITDRDPEGMEVLRLIEFAEEDEPARPDEPEAIEEIEVPVVAPTAVFIDREPGADLGPPPPSGADLIRPDLKDARLWRSLDPSIAELSLEQREELLLSGRIVEWFDSLTIAIEAERALTDWTFTDADGKRWGFADGKIYLGDMVLPGMTFGVPVGKRDEYAERMWQWDEIQRQGARMEVVESWKERQAAIRERRDRERAARPDTIRGGR